MQPYLTLLMGMVASASSGKTGQYASVSCPVHPDPYKKQSNSGCEEHAVVPFLKNIHIYVGFTNFSEAFKV